MRALYHFGFRLRGELQKGDLYHQNVVQSLVKWYESGKIFWLYRRDSMTCTLRSLYRDQRVSSPAAISGAHRNGICGRLITLSRSGGREPSAATGIESKQIVAPHHLST